MNDHMGAIDPVQCPVFIKKFWYEAGTFDRLIATLKGAVANAPPVLMPSDGIPLKGGSFAASAK